MSIESEADLIALQKIGRIVANCLQVVGRALEPGMTTKGLDDVGQKFLEFHGAKSAPQLVYDFPGYYDPKDKRVLKKNQVITIEPFLSTGARQVFDTGDGWTLATDKRYLTAQCEHTMVITKGRALIMTLPA